MTSFEETDMAYQICLQTLQDAFQRYKAATLTDDQVAALDTAISDFQTALDAVLA